MVGADAQGQAALLELADERRDALLAGGGDTAVDPRVRGTATSVALGCWSITNALLPTLAGYLMDRRLLAWPLVLGLACYSTAAIWFWLTLRHTPLPEEMAAHEVPVTGPGAVKPSAAR